MCLHSSLIAITGLALTETPQAPIPVIRMVRIPIGHAATHILPALAAHELPPLPFFARAPDQHVLLPFTAPLAAFPPLLSPSLGRKHVWQGFSKEIFRGMQNRC